MSTDNDAPVRLRTRVGVVSPTELHFAGHEVGSLLGSSYWRLLSLSIDGPEIGEQATRTLDHLATCTLACDPRLWPLKLVQLGASYGQISAGLCAGSMATEGSPMSYWAAGPAARYLRGLVAELGSSPSDERLAAYVRPTPPPGFGVYGRAQDVRVLRFRQWRERASTAAGPFEALIGRMETPVNTHHDQRIRIEGLVGAVLLDLGFEPDQAAVVGGLLNALPMVLANAHEGSRRGAALRELPQALLTYVGAPPRRSTRIGRQTPRA